MKKIIALAIFGLGTVIMIWGAIGFVAIHFIKKVW